MYQVKVVLYFWVVFLLKEISCIKDVVLSIEPSIVERGQKSTLTCSYNLEDSPLYTVKFYRGHHEFYRYTPSQHPSTKIFPYIGVNVDSKQSNEHQVVLQNVEFNLSGKFSCEVTTDAPGFQTVIVSKNMRVVVLPHDPPTLNTDKSFYDVGDVLNANCTSAASRPAANLTFKLNDIVVCEKCKLRQHTEQDLRWTESTLELPLFSSHFNNGRLTLKCVAEIADLYQQDTEITFDNVKDPVPARVMYSTASTISSSILYIELLYLFSLYFL